LVGTIWARKRELRGVRRQGHLRQRYQAGNEKGSLYQETLAKRGGWKEGKKSPREVPQPRKSSLREFDSVSVTKRPFLMNGTDRKDAQVAQEKKKTWREKNGQAIMAGLAIVERSKEGNVREAARSASPTGLERPVDAESIIEGGGRTMAEYKL